MKKLLIILCLMPFCLKPRPRKQSTQQLNPPSLPSTAPRTPVAYTLPSDSIDGSWRNITAALLVTLQEVGPKYDGSKVKVYATPQPRPMLDVVATIRPLLNRSDDNIYLLSNPYLILMTQQGYSKRCGLMWLAAQLREHPYWLQIDSRNQQVIQFHLNDVDTKLFYLEDTKQKTYVTREYNGRSFSAQQILSDR